MTGGRPMRVDLGRVVATPGALRMLDESGESPLVFLVRHATGDCGDMCDEDRAMNEAAIRKGKGRVFSSYCMPGESTWRLWVITESDRSVTTLTLPQEY